MTLPRRWRPSSSWPQDSGLGSINSAQRPSCPPGHLRPIVVLIGPGYPMKRQNNSVPKPDYDQLRLEELFLWHQNGEFKTDGGFHWSQTKITHSDGSLINSKHDSYLTLHSTGRDSRNTLKAVSLTCDHTDSILFRVHVQVKIPFVYGFRTIIAYFVNPFINGTEYYPRAFALSSAGTTETHRYSLTQTGSTCSFDYSYMRNGPYYEFRMKKTRPNDSSPIPIWVYDRQNQRITRHLLYSDKFTLISPPCYKHGYLNVIYPDVRDGNDSAESCILCLANKREIRFDPCGHLLSCQACSMKLDSICPLCKQEILKFEKTYCP